VVSGNFQLGIAGWHWSRMPRASPSEVPTQFWSRFYNLVKDQILVTKTSHQTHWALTHEPSSLTSATHLSRLLFPLVMIRKAVGTTTFRRPRGPWFHGLVALFEGWKENRPARGPTVPVGSGNFQLEIAGWHWSRMYLASPSELPTQFRSRSCNFEGVQICVSKTSQQTHWALTHEPSSLTSATRLSRLLFPLAMIWKVVIATTVRRPRGPWFHGLAVLFVGWKKDRPPRRQDNCGGTIADQRE